MKVLKLVRNEIKADFKANGLLWMLLVSFVFGFIWIFRSPSEFSMYDYQTEYFRGFFFVSLFMSGYLLSKQLEKGTIKYQLASVSSRMSVWNAKMIAIVFYAIMFWILSCVYGAILIAKGSVESDLAELFSVQRLIAYILTDVVMAGFAYLLTLFIKNKFVIEIIMLLLWGIPYQLLPFFMYYEEFKKYFTGSLKEKLAFIPQYDIVSWMVDDSFTVSSVLIVIGFSLIFNIIAAIKFKRLEV